MMHRLVYPLAVLLLLGVANSVFASAMEDPPGSGILVIVLDFDPPLPSISEPFDQSATIVVVDDPTSTPPAHQVTISGVPNDTTTPPSLFDGETFFGINRIEVNTGRGNDKVSFDIITTQELLDIAVNSLDLLGQAETKIKMVALPSALPGAGPFVSNIDLALGNLEDKLELEFDSHRDTNLTVDAMGSSGEKSIVVKAMYGSGTDVNNTFDFGLGGFEDETLVEIKSVANHLNNSFSVDSGAGEDLTKIVIEHLGAQTDPMVLSHSNSLMLSKGSGEDGTEVIIKSPNAAVGLSGMIDAGTLDDKVNIEVDGPDVDMTSLSITGGSGRDELGAGFKGLVNLSGALTLSAGDGDDKLKLLVGGLVGPGSATLDGGGGFDECEAFLGVTFTSCEIEKP